MNLKWIDVDESLDFYLNQKDYLKKACETLESHWSYDRTF